MSDEPWDAPFVHYGVAERPVVILAPDSALGWAYGPNIIATCRNVIAVVDNNDTKSEIHGVTRWGFDELRANARIPDLIGIDLSTSPLGYSVFTALARSLSIPVADFPQALAELDLPAVYQKPILMRERTIAKRAEYVQLRASLADELSRQTLDAFVALRLTLRRDKIREIYAPSADEYFSVGASENTFRLGRNEALCDAGAYRGSVIQKFIAATHGKFDVIHAFEPDRKNFALLCKLATLPFDNIKLHHKAVGDRSGYAHFWETGTTGSHVLLNEKASENTVPITRIDDAMDRVTFIKMDLESFEARALRGASGLIREFRPRMAITAYHYVDDLLDICATIRELMPTCSLRLRQHHLSFYDTVVYAAAAT